MMTKMTKWSVVLSFLLIGHFCHLTRSNQPRRDHNICNIKMMSATKKEGNITSSYYTRNRSQGFKCSHHLWGKPSERVKLTFMEMNLRGGGGADDGDQLMVVTSVGKNTNSSLPVRPSTTDFLKDPPPSPPSTLEDHRHHDHHQSRLYPSTFHPRSIVGTPGYGVNNSPIASSLLDQGKYTIVWVYKGQAKPPTLMSSGNHVVVITVMKPWQEESGKMPGFWLDYKFITDFGIKGGKQDASEECIFRFNSRQSSSSLDKEKFWSPNYPGPYPFSTDCYYYFTRANDEVLTIKFHHLDIDGIPLMCSNESESDFLEFSSPFRERSIRICTSHPEVNIPKSRRSFTFGPGGRVLEANSAPSALVSDPGKDGEVIKVKFHSNSRFNAQGFLGEYLFEKSTGLRVSYLSAAVAVVAIFMLDIRF